MPSDITLAMIVRDGEETLGRCLDSVSRLVSSIVIVDTGSVDRSIAVARRAGADVFEMEWPDAYDVARNFGLDRVATEWVLVLDDDEWLEPGAVEILAEETANPDAAAYGLFRKDYDPHGGFAEQWTLRLWRHRPEIRFRGVIHEQIYAEDVRRATGLDAILTSGARYGHDGYRVDSTPEQEQNELRMIRKELQLRPNQLYFQCLQASLEAKLELPEASKHLRDIAQICLDHERQPTPPHPEVALPLAASLVRIPATELGSNRTGRLATLAWKWFGDSPLVLYALADLERRRQQVSSRHTVLCRLGDLAITGKYSRHRSFDSSILGVWLWKELLQTSKRLGAGREAKVAAEQLLRYEPENAEALEIVVR